jgi:regulator of PEP synthase PpsR (kinase-PPPase family)
MARRTVFFVSDQTGVTAETMGHSLLTQFDGLEFRQVTLPFISSADKAVEAVRKINATALDDGARPIVFSTLVKEEVRSVVKGSDGLFLDFFDAFLGPLEAELKVKSSEREGRAHGIADQLVYSTRIEATNFALAADDGGVTTDYQRADVILVGVSRSGKTPTCIYMAMQYGVFAANYPFTEEDFEGKQLPALVRPYTGSRSRPSACSRSATSAVPAAATPRSLSASTRCGPPRTCSSASASPSSTPPSARSRRSRAG